MLIAEGMWCCRECVARGPVYFSPSSPGANVTAEQKPSDDVISRVEPSFDLYDMNDNNQSTEN